jgi:hypothetical protein
MRQSNRSSELILQTGRVATYLCKLPSNDNYVVVSINRFTINIPTLSITHFPRSTADCFILEQDDKTMILQEEVVVPDEIEVVVVVVDEPDEEVVVVPDETVEVVEEKDNVVEVSDVVDEDDTAEEEEEEEDEEDEEDEEEEEEEEDDKEESYVGGIWGVDDYFHEDGPPEGHIPYYGYYYGSD